MKEYLSQQKIEKRVSELGEQITKDYQGDELLVIGILKGGFVFCADLVRKIENDNIKVEFLSASSYGDGMTSSGNVSLRLDLSEDIESKHVLLVEDIIDTGLTLSKIIKTLKVRNPKSIKLASLLLKPDCLKAQLDIHYLGFEIENKFVVGYGLDYAGNYRQLPYVGIYNE